MTNETTHSGTNDTLVTLTITGIENVTSDGLSTSTTVRTVNFTDLIPSTTAKVNNVTESLTTFTTERPSSLLTENLTFTTVGMNNVTDNLTLISTPWTDNVTIPLFINRTDSSFKGNSSTNLPLVSTTTESGNNNVSSIFSSSTRSWNLTTPFADNEEVVDIRAIYFLIVGIGLVAFFIAVCVVFAIYRSGLCDSLDEKRMLKKREKRRKRRPLQNSSLTGLSVINESDNSERRVNFPETTNNTQGSVLHDQDAPRELTTFSGGQLGLELDPLSRSQGLSESSYDELYNSDDDDENVFYDNPGFDDQTINIRL